MRSAPDIKRLTVITGHYGCGKTNLSINLALDLATTGEPVTLVDLDIVNPYFRSSDYTQMLAERGVDVIAPTFAGTTLDTPALSPAIAGVFEREGFVIFDVGGDDVGATALGRYATDIAAADYDLLYVVNRYRSLTGTAEEAAAVLREIEAVCRLRATGIVNNSHLKRDTTVQTVLDSMDFARETAAVLGLPLRFTTYPSWLESEFRDASGPAGTVSNAYNVAAYVRTPWEDPPDTAEEVMA